MSFQWTKAPRLDIAPLKKAIFIPHYPIIALSTLFAETHVMRVINAVCISQGMRQGRAGQGRAGQGRAGQGRVEQSRTGQGRAGWKNRKGKAGAGLKPT